MDTNRKHNNGSYIRGAWKYRANAFPCKKVEGRTGFEVGSGNIDRQYHLIRFFSMYMMCFGITSLVDIYVVNQ